MIIQCKECGTQYRFDKSQIDGEGIWVRCSRCEAVFFQENPLVEIASLIESMEAEGDIRKSTNEQGAEDIIDRVFGEAETEDDDQEPEQNEPYSDADEFIGNTGFSEREEIRGFWTLGRKIVFCLLIIVLCGGLYLWLSPHARDVVFPKVEKILGIQSSDVPDVELSGLEVNLINVKERFAKNLIAGDIMVIEGLAVNNNTCAVSNIKIRGKILDSSGNILSEEESNCGNILTDDELKNLTEKEIRKELSNPYGREFSGIDIEPDKDIPFMLAFVMPAAEASEFVVELAGVEVANSK